MLSGPARYKYPKLPKAFIKQSCRAYPNAENVLVCEWQSAGVTAKLIGTSKQPGTEIEFGRRLQKIFRPTVVETFGGPPCHFASCGETGREVRCKEVAIVGYLSQGSRKEGRCPFISIPDHRFGGVREVAADPKEHYRYIDFVAIGAVSQCMLTCAEHSCHVEAVCLAIICRTDLLEVCPEEVLLPEWKDVLIIMKFDEGEWRGIALYWGINGCEA